MRFAISFLPASLFFGSIVSCNAILGNDDKVLADSGAETNSEEATGPAAEASTDATVPNKPDADMADVDAEAKSDGVNGSDGDAGASDATDSGLADGEGGHSCTPSIEAGLPPPTACTGDGWCWANPVPVGVDFHDVRGSCGAVWAVGSGGAVLLWDGNGWQGVSSGTMADLYRLASTGPNDVWAVGDLGTVIHWDGTAWTTRSISQTLAASSANYQLSVVWASAANDVWASNLLGNSFHWDGTRWSSVPELDSLGLTFGAMWGSSPTDVWAVAQSGSIYHWNGQNWTQSSSGVTTALYDVWGSAANDVWAIGRNSVIHWNGTGWTVVDIGISSNDTIERIWGSSSTDVWVLLAGDANLLRHFDGSSWTPALKTPAFVYAWPTAGASVSTNELFVVGPLGMITHGVGGAWTQMDTGLRSVDIRGIYGQVPDDLWLVGQSSGAAGNTGGVTLNWNGSALVTVAPPQTSALWGIYGDGSLAFDAVWVVGYGGTWHSNGAGWTAYSVPSMANQNLYAVWGPPFTGSTIPDMWTVGDGPSIYHWDGSRWSLQSVALDGGAADGGLGDAGPPPALRAIGGTGINDIWAVGDAGLVVHWDGATWHAVPSGTTARLTSVAAISTAEVWVAGSGSGLSPDTVLRWNGTAFSLEPFPATGFYGGATSTLWSAGTSSDLWLLSASNSIYKWSGSDWTEMGGDSSWAYMAYALWGTPSGGSYTVWAGGAVGALRHYR